MTEKIDVDALRALEAKATRGPWQVVIDRFDYNIPTVSEGVERKIATAWDHPQLKGPLPIVAMCARATDDNRFKRGVHIEENDAALIVALRNAAAALLAAYEAHDAAVRERDEAKRELRKCTINKDELWKVVRADADKLRQVTADGEDVTQMLVQRDKEADEQIADLAAERDALKAVAFQAQEMAKEIAAERDEYAARASLIDEAQDANAGLVRKLTERDERIASQAATIATLTEALEPFACGCADGTCDIGNTRGCAHRRARTALNSARSA